MRRVLIGPQCGRDVRSRLQTREYDGRRLAGRVVERQLRNRLRRLRAAARILLDPRAVLPEI
jgi:hypothetical protein